jgi:hypothetical protein
MRAFETFSNWTTVEMRWQDVFCFIQHLEQPAPAEYGNRLAKQCARAKVRLWERGSRFNPPSSADYVVIMNFLATFGQRHAHVSTDRISPARKDGWLDLKEYKRRQVRD